MWRGCRVWCFLILTSLMLKSYRVLALTIASELAAARSDVRGTGTFLPALIDELYNLTAAKIQQYAKIEVVG